MTLEEQFEKETGMKYGYVPSGNRMVGFNEWLKEKLTWKKFEGRVESYPIFVKFKREAYEKTDSFSVMHTMCQELFDEIEMYMPVPPLPNNDI